MDSFSNRLGAWLAAHETDRRGGMFALLTLALFSGYFGVWGFVTLFGVCLMAEGVAMLLSSAAQEDTGIR